MTPEQYHRMQVGLDKALTVMHESPASLTTEDIELKLQLTLTRAHVIRAESGHPFPLHKPKPIETFKADPDPELTTLPWSER